MTDEDFPRTIYLNDEEWARFLETLANPPPPTPFLIEAMRRYMEAIAEGRLTTDTTSVEEAKRWLESRS